MKLGSSIESTKTSRRGENGARRIVTRIVRKTTTLTRGEEDRVPEELPTAGQQKSIQEVRYHSTSHQQQQERQQVAKPKSVRVRPPLTKQLQINFHQKNRAYTGDSGKRTC